LDADFGLVMALVPITYSKKTKMVCVVAMLITPLLSLRIPLLTVRLLNCGFALASVEYQTPVPGTSHKSAGICDR
jgi:hypothetical protein